MEIENLFVSVAKLPLSNGTGRRTKLCFPRDIEKLLGFNRTFVQNPKNVKLMAKLWKMEEQVLNRVFSFRINLTLKLSTFRFNLDTFIQKISRFSFNYLPGTLQSTECTKNQRNINESDFISQ